MLKPEISTLPSPLYSVMADSFDIVTPPNKKNTGPDYLMAYSVPVRFRTDTILSSCNFVQNFKIDHNKNKQTPEITVIAKNAYWTKYFAEYKYSKTFSSDDSIIYKGYNKESSINIFSEKEILINDLEFHISGKIYKVKYSLETITTYNKLDYLLTKAVINSIALQLTILLFFNIGITYLLSIIKKYVR